MDRIDGLLAAGAPPFVAILRGLRPAEAVETAHALVEAGIALIEVPLNSPEPFESITAIQAAFGDRALIGAGTVLRVEDVDRLAATGAKLLVAPNIDPLVLGRGVALGLEAMPGILTPSEAFSAIGLGARKLKLFPSSAMGPAYVRSLRDVLPKDVQVWAVGGVGPDEISGWLDAGVAGFGVGGAIYKPGDTPQIVHARAKGLIAAWEAL